MDSQYIPSELVVVKFEWERLLSAKKKCSGIVWRIIDIIINSVIMGS